MAAHTPSVVPTRDARVGRDHLRLLRGGVVVTMNARRDVLVDGGVLLRSDRILEVGRASELRLKYPGAEEIECQDHVVVPGLVNTHTHLFQSLLKGIGDDLLRSDWSARGIRASAALLTAEDVYAAARHGAVESIKSGVTTLVDFAYGSPREQMVEPVVRALDQVGIRGVVGRTLVTAHSPELDALREDADVALAAAESLIKDCNRPDARVRVALAPSMIWGVDRYTLEQTQRLAERTQALVMMHIAETETDGAHALRVFGMREVPLLESIGLLTSDLLAVHCVHLDGEDIAKIAQHTVSVSHNPCSNLYLGAGIAPIAEMLSLGVNVALGTDGAASNNNLSLLQSMKFASLLQKGRLADGSVFSAERALEVATLNGARALHLCADTGSLEAGKKADITAFRLDGFSVTPVHNAVSALVYSAIGNEADVVIIDGNIVLKDGRLTALSETDIRRDAERAARQLSLRAGTTPQHQRTWSRTA